MTPQDTELLTPMSVALGLLALSLTEKSKPGGYVVKISLQSHSIHTLVARLLRQREGKAPRFVLFLALTTYADQFLSQAAGGAGLGRQW